MYLIVVQKRVYLWPLGMEYSYGIILINLKTLCNALTSICDGGIKKIKKEARKLAAWRGRPCP